MYPWQEPVEYLPSALLPATLILVLIVDGCIAGPGPVFEYNMYKLLAF